ncbi:MAG: type II secretion system protein GspD [Planctomycetota bacterium]
MTLRTWWVALVTGCSLGLFGTGGSRTCSGAEEGASPEAAGGGSIGEYFARPERAEAESSEYITFDVKDKDLNEVLRFIGRRVGVNIVADPDVREKVTIQLDRVDWRSALDVIARQTRCTIVRENERLYRFTQPPSISMEFQDSDIKVVLDLLAKQAGANIVIGSDVQGKVSLSLREVPWREALQTVVETVGYVIVKADTKTGSEILRVVRPESLKDQLVTEYFQLTYLRPSDPYVAVISDVEKYAAYDGGDRAGGKGAKGGGEGGSRGFSLEEALRDTLSKDGSLRYDENTNTFIVKDTKPKLDEIRDIIRRVDVRQPQIYVEVKFIRTRNADILERGVKFDDPNTPERDGFQGILRFPEPDPTAVDPLFLHGGTYPFDFGSLSDFADNFQTLGILDFTRTRALLKLVKDDENSRIVQEPTLTVLDNKPATIFVGDEVPFAVQKVQQDQNGNTTVSIEENERSPINVGFTLYLIPHVVPNTDMINLTVVPKVSDLSGTTSPIVGFERFSFEEGSGGSKNTIDLPRQSLQTVVTYLRVHAGHTAVIGGLRTERKSEIETKVPILSDIPVVGNIFTWKRKDSRLESIIILVTPYLLRSPGESDVRFQEALKRHQERDYFYQKYEKPKDEAREETAAARPPETAPAEVPAGSGT